MKKKYKKQINKLILKSYPVSKNDITQEHWALGKKN